MDQRDCALLLEQGLTQEQITIAVQVIGYFNYINRVADGLGVDPEDWMQPSPVEWRRRKCNWRLP
jgi:alkylhydroperoxidase family enzyme